MKTYFTEGQWLMLASLGYAIVPQKSFNNKTGHIKKGQKVPVATLFDQLDTSAAGGECKVEAFKNPQEYENYLTALESTKKKLKEKNWLVSKSINHNKTNESGFVAFAIEPEDNTQKEIIVCCRGSDAMDLNIFSERNTLNDWLFADVALVLGIPTAQQNELMAFTADLEENYNQISFVGHSLGGNLAIFGAIASKNPGCIGEVNAFDAPGFEHNILELYKDNIEKTTDKIKNFQNEHDLISSTFKSLGSVEVIKSAIKKTDFITNHNRWAFAVDKYGDLQRNASKEKDAACKGWHVTTNVLTA
ncbi:MAG: DUF2974 domain-containing protein [Oscillospiraceae bacterium]|jgi:hypothetical protein|nr:DUF2974 domain-containing protein [Oscillospiraceae bacterium]